MGADHCTDFLKFANSFFEKTKKWEGPIEVEFAWWLRDVNTKQRVFTPFRFGTKSHRPSEVVGDTSALLDEPAAAPGVCNIFAYRFHSLLRYNSCQNLTTPLKKTDTK